MVKMVMLFLNPKIWHTRQTCGAWIGFLQRIYEEKIKIEWDGEKWRIREKVEEKEGWRKDHLQVPTGYFPVRKDTEDGLR